MGQFFSLDYAGVPFDLFGAAHIGALVGLVVLNLFLIKLGRANETIRRGIRWTLALALMLNELAWHAWNIAVGTWSVQTMLPLHLCSVFVWVTAVMLLTRDYRLYEFAYFLGIGGATQILITPDLGIYGYPHFRFFQTLLSHGLIVTAAIYMTVVEGYRPTWRSLGKVVLWTHAYIVLIFLVNSVLGSNYLNINFKPDVPGLLQFLPDWPGYVFWMDAIGIVICLLLYLPFFVRDRRSAASN